jgi:hypothetical protein
LEVEKKKRKKKKKKKKKNKKKKKIKKEKKKKKKKKKVRKKKKRKKEVATFEGGFHARASWAWAPPARRARDRGRHQARPPTRSSQVPWSAPDVSEPAQALRTRRGPGRRVSCRG